MKRLLVLLSLMGLLMSEAYADDVKIGYVDLRKVLTESKAGKRTKGEIEKVVKQRQDTLVKDEQKLKTLQEAFEKDKLILSEVQKQQKQQEFQQKLQAYQKAAGEAQREVGQKEAEFTKKAIPEIKAIISEVAKEEKLVLVFEKNEMPVLYATEGPDLTDKVLKKYDAKGAK